jgi:hypothetical protein
MKWFIDVPEISEQKYREESDFNPWEWRKIAGIWVNVYRGWVKTPAGILVMED